MLNDYFDNIYILYINEEELNNIIPKLKKNKIKAELFMGVNGHKEVNKYNKYLSTVTDSKQLSPGSYGHVSSLINILQDAIEKKYENILLLEPDIYFSKSFNKDIIHYLDLYEKMKYDIIYLGASQNKYYTENTWITINKNQNLKLGYYNAYKTLGTFAIGFSKNIYSKLLFELKKYKFPSDVVIVNIQPTIKCLVTYPNIICCNITKSTTSNFAINNNQIMKMESYKWILEYEIDNTYIYTTQQNKWYDILIDINSIYQNYEIEIDNVIMNTKTICVKGVNKLKITHYVKNTSLKIKTNNIFINNLQIILRQ